MDLMFYNEDLEYIEDKSGFAIQAGWKEPQLGCSVTLEGLRYKVKNIDYDYDSQTIYVYLERE
jgi:hypothetical protein